MAWVTNRKNKHSAYKYIYKMRIQKALTYRFDVFSSIIFQCIVMFAAAFFWRAIYIDTSSMEGISVTDMLTYTIVSSAMSVILMTGVEQRLMDSVEKGTVATDMIKPVPLFGIYFFEDLGNITSLFFLNVIPIILIGGFFIATPLPANGTYAALFVLSFILSFMVNWLFAALFSLLSFVTINMSPLVQVKKHVLRLLSGSIIPIWFFPDQVKFILELLPFIYIYQLPLDIYIGKYSYNVILLKMGIQLLWVIFLFAAFLIAERHMQRKVMVQGG